MRLWGWYFLASNLFAFLLFGLDKRRAKKRAWRIPERTLLFAAFIGGAAGSLFGMLLFRHKIRKPLFYLGVPTLLIMQCALCYLCLGR